MNIVVCIKQVVDTAVRVEAAQRGELRLGDAKFIINPHDEYAIEQGVRFKEALGGTVCVLSLGGSSARDAVMTALAMGADKAVLVESDDAGALDEGAVASLLSSVIEERCFPGEEVDCVIVGKESSDRGGGQVPHLLAEELRCPTLYGVVEVRLEDGMIKACCIVDGQRLEVEASLPLVIVAQKGLNEPRFAPLAGLMKAKKKPFETIPLASVADRRQSPAAPMRVVEYRMPAERDACKMIAGDDPHAAAGELAQLLRVEAKAI